MRLLTKYSRINMLVTVIIMLVTGIIYYYTISHILTRQIDDDLVLEENEIFSYVKINGRLPRVFESNHQQIYFAPAGSKSITRRFVDTTYHEPGDDDMEAGRALVSSVKVGNNAYKITVTQSKVETEYLIKIIFLITVAVLLALLVVLMILNRFILKSIWQPFYRILSQLNTFSLAELPEVTSIPSKIDEFTELDKAVQLMTDSVKKDYFNLKSFTENASHELMTPISVINSKLDTLVQTDEFTDKQSKLLNDIYGTVARLTRLNKSMLLLAKIENRVIADKQEIELQDIIDESLEQLDEMFNRFDLNLTTSLQCKKLHANRSLIEILINNLLTNAIRHSVNGSTIEVLLDDKHLEVSNSGYKAIDFDTVLRRFQKSDESDGIGLGLTLCKQICDNHQFKFGYRYDTGFHRFSVEFQ